VQKIFPVNFYARKFQYSANGKVAGEVDEKVKNGLALAGCRIAISISIVLGAA